MGTVSFQSAEPRNSSPQPDPKESSFKNIPKAHVTGVIEATSSNMPSCGLFKGKQPPMYFGETTPAVPRRLRDTSILTVAGSHTARGAFFTWVAPEGRVQTQSGDPKGSAGTGTGSF